MRGLSLVAASGGHSLSRCAGLSLLRPLSRRASSVIVAHGPSCSAARGIFPDQGSNPCPLHWQADSQPLRHQGSPYSDVFKVWSFIDSFNRSLLSIFQVFKLLELYQVSQTQLPIKAKRVTQISEADRVLQTEVRLRSSGERRPYLTGQLLFSSVAEHEE